MLSLCFYKEYTTHIQEWQMSQLYDLKSMFDYEISYLIPLRVKVHTTTYRHYVFHHSTASTKASATVAG